MKRATRRQFLETSAIASVGMGSWLALGKPPAYAQKRELTFLSWNHFVPASDDELRKQAEAFSKQAGVSVRVDTIAHLQLMAKFAAEAQSQSGHDMIRTHDAIPFLFESQLGDVGDVVDKLGKQHGGWYSFAAEACQTKSGWRAVPWFWISFPATYNMAHFKKAGLETPKTWAALLSHGRTLKKQGNPVGIAISHCGDANTTAWSVLSSYGAKVIEADGKTPDINSALPILGLGVCKFSKNIDFAKEFIQFLYRKENYDAWIGASNACNHPPLRHFADHPIWARNPKFAMLPKEAEYAHPRGWPAKPSDAAQRVDEAFVLPDMTAKAVNGMPTKRAMEWAQDQVARAIKGQLKVG